MSRESRLQILECHSPSFKKQLDDLESRLQILKCHSPILRKELDDIGLSQHELNADIKKLQKYRDREYAGGVVCIRNRLAQMFLSSAQNAQRKQQIANPIDVRVNVYDQNALAYDVNLSTTINQADMHPDYFDICLDTVSEHQKISSMIYLNGIRLVNIKFTESSVTMEKLGTRALLIPVQILSKHGCHQQSVFKNTKQRYPMINLPISKALFRIKRSKSRNQFKNGIQVMQRTGQITERNERSVKR